MYIQKSTATGQYTYVVDLYIDSVIAVNRLD